MLRRLLAIAGLLAAALVPPAGAAHAQPKRIVSLDLCTDQLLVGLVPRKRIAAVTHLAADTSVSAIPEAARGLAITHGYAEDVLALAPDLVLAGPYGVRATVDLLQRLGLRVVIVQPPQDIPAVRAAVQAVAAAVGEEARGAAVIAEFDRRLAAAVSRVPRTDRQPSALVYQVGGSVSGGTLADAALTVSGFRNAASTYRLTRAGQVPLETLVADPPDLIVLSSTPGEYRTALADNLNHPALGRLLRKQTSLELPWRYLLCGTPHIVEAVERLTAARAALDSGVKAGAQ